MILHAGTSLSVCNLCRSLQISCNATYQHVAALERDGLIQKDAIAQTKGRPGQTFQLTDKGQNIFPKHYSLFAKLLVKLIKSRIGTDELKECMEELGQALAEGFEERTAGLQGDALIIEVVNIMQELGYEAEAIFREDENGLQIRAYNCVFHDLAKEHEEVCALDTSFIASLTKESINHVECLVRGGSSCRFCIKRTHH